VKVGWRWRCRCRGRGVRLWRGRAVAAANGFDGLIFENKICTEKESKIYPPPPVSCNTTCINATFEPKQ
jgi:hypothetical protein